MSEIIQNIKLKAQIAELEAELAGLHSILNDPIAIMKQKQLIAHLEESLARSGALLADTEAKLDNAMAEANDLRLRVAGLLIEIKDLSNE